MTVTNNLDNLYAFADVGEKEDRSFIKILKGPLEGAVIKIHTIKFGEHENPDGTMDLHINHDFVEEPTMKPTDEQVNEVLGLVIVDILDQYMLGGELSGSFELA